MCGHQTEPMLREYREAIKSNPRYIYAHTGLGMVLGKSGDLVGAERKLREAIKLDPSSADAHYYLGVTLKHKGDLEGAERQYRKAFKLDPRRTNGHNSIGVLLKEKGDLEGLRGNTARPSNLILAVSMLMSPSESSSQTLGI